MRGYLNALMVLSFFVSEREAATTNCKVRSGSNLTMTLDQSSVNVRQVSLYKDKKEIASSRSLSVGWDDFLDKKYENRLILNATGNMTVHLHRVIVDDEGNYTTTVFWENGSSLKKYWNIKLEDFTEPEVIGKFTISVTKDKEKFHCTCGEFKDDTIPQLRFKWNTSSHRVRELLCTRNDSLSCTASWPVSECQDVIKTWTDSHRGEPAADGGSKSGTGRKKRSADDGCDQVNNTSPDSTHEATTGYTEVTPVHIDVVTAIVPISVILLTAVIVIVIVIVTVYCLWRRKKCPKRQKDRNRNKRGPETKDEMMEIRKRGSPNFEHEAKDSPDEEKTEMMDQKEKST